MKQVVVSGGDVHKFDESIASQLRTSDPHSPMPNVSQDRNGKG